jgi:hypothetical protein
VWELLRIGIKITITNFFILLPSGRGVEDIESVGSVGCLPGLDFFWIRIWAKVMRMDGTKQLLSSQAAGAEKEARGVAGSVVSSVRLEP